MTIETPELQNDLLMYSLNTSNWTAYKRDDKATAQVKAMNGVKETTDAGNFNKLLLPDFPELKAINSFIGSVRNNWFYVHTAAWGEQRGIRVGKVEYHMQRLQEFGEHMDKLKPLIEAAAEAYPSKVSQAEFELQDMFNPNDYPDVDDFRRKFDMRMPSVPLNNPNDIRLMTKIPEHIREEMEASMRADMSKALEQTTKDVLTQLYEPLAHMAVTLKGYHDGKIKKLYDSVIDNVLKMAEAARTLNFTNNPDIEALAAEAEEFARGVTTKDLKDSDGLQVVTGKKAQALANRIAKFMP